MMTAEWLFLCAVFGLCMFLWGFRSATKIYRGF